MMFGNLIMPSTTIDGYNRRISIVIIVLASLAVLLVATSVAAFVYVTRKGEHEDKSKLI
jgi:flagellar basal body-associated protein FliL